MEPKIVWLGHASFRIESDLGVIYIDPWKLKNTVPADYILITHSHFDHLSMDDINKIRKRNTVIVGPSDVVEQVKGAVKISPGDRKNVGRIAVEGIHAYNPKKEFHPKSNQWLGYVVDIGGYRIYHSGDADRIPEMGKLGGVDVALLPVGGTYTMDPSEAAQAVGLIKPKKAIPMHWGDIIGGIENAQEFSRLADCPVEILKPE
ncbi:MAG: MBL fold metallo-hydrolase [Thermoplasmatota archaeon]